MSTLLEKSWIVLCFFCLSFQALGQERHPFIINGTPTDDYPAVGIVGEASVGGFCTGTLISPRHVLTAAHCAEAILEFGDQQSGTFEVGGRIYRTVIVEIVPSYDSRNFTDDVAILVLDEPVSDIQPAVLSSDPPEVGELVTIVGFGGQGAPEDGSDGSFGEKLVGFATVDNVTETEFSWDFDNPAESNPAPGDSGGPVFVDSENGLLLAGIVSSGTQLDAGLGDTNFNMRVDAYSDFILETLDATQAVLDASGEPPEEVSEEEVAETPDADGSETVDVDSEQAADESIAGEESEGACAGNRHRHRGRGNCNDVATNTSGCVKPCKPNCTNDAVVAGDEVDVAVDASSEITDTEPIDDSVETSPGTEIGTPESGVEIALPDSGDGTATSPGGEETPIEAPPTGDFEAPPTFGVSDAVADEELVVAEQRRKNKPRFRRPLGSYWDRSRMYRVDSGPRTYRSRINVRR